MKKTPDFFAAGSQFLGAIVPAHLLGVAADNPRYLVRESREVADSGLD